MFANLGSWFPVDLFRFVGGWQASCMQSRPGSWPSMAGRHNHPRRIRFFFFNSATSHVDQCNLIGAVVLKFTTGARRSKTRDTGFFIEDWSPREAGPRQVAFRVHSRGRHGPPQTRHASDHRSQLRGRPVFRNGQSASKGDEFAGGRRDRSPRWQVRTTGAHVSFFATELIRILEWQPIVPARRGAPRAPAVPPAAVVAPPGLASRPPKRSNAMPISTNR